MSKFRETVLDIDLKAVTQNFNFIKSKLKPNTKLLAVVKAFAYGSDAEEVAKHLETLNVDYFAVAYTHEGISLRKAGITSPILVLHSQPIHFKLLIEHCLEPSIYSMRVLNEFIRVSEQEKQTSYPVHIKFNTGLNRLGFNVNEVNQITSTLLDTKSIKVASIFSHLAASDDENENAFTLQQIEAFKNVSKELKNQLDYTPFLHLCNTSGLLNYPEAHFDMVRSGIGLYGFGNNSEIDKHLKPISTLKTCISQIHSLKKGDSLGYNCAFIAKKNTKTATLPIGHADGINRAFGNQKGFVFVNKQKAYIIGNVCMDMIMIDVTDINCQEGDEVVVFDATHNATDLAENVNSISYELITSVSQRIKRTLRR
ncbi:alanine racemase [Aurantibacter sp.]|uniref:alanine racemase n=1 Tax=Aurantibacter sp. TaxID=2807103 RepID=UPI0035C7D589